MAPPHIINQYNNIQFLGANFGITSSGLRILFNSASGGGGGSSLAAGDVAAAGGTAFSSLLTKTQSTNTTAYRMDGLWPLQNVVIFCCCTTIIIVVTIHQCWDDDASTTTIKTGFDGTYPTITTRKSMECTQGNDVGIGGESFGTIATSRPTKHYRRNCHNLQFGRELQQQ